MRSIRWSVKWATYRPERPKGRRTERPFASRERWIFSPVGILAENKIGIFVISAFHTDDVLVKRENLQQAVRALQDAGYVFEK